MGSPSSNFPLIDMCLIVDDSEPQGIDEMQEDVDLMPQAVGFGYDVQCGDFKVVRVMSHWREGVCYPSKVKIYDLRKDRWREIKTIVDVDVFWHPSFDTYQEGTFYWFGLSGLNEKEVILTFDMSKEVFGKISIP
ncbi:hypothetical protein Csa_000940 [Cucumis sativus]|nr:hypothetical protein Csa_000940 [Cucumis sativus]